MSNFQKNKLPQNRAKKNWKTENRHKNKSVSILDYIAQKSPIKIPSGEYSAHIESVRNLKGAAFLVFRHDIEISYGVFLAGKAVVVLF